MLPFFLLIIELNVLISIVIAQSFNHTGKLAILLGIPTKKAKADT